MDLSAIPYKFVASVLIAIGTAWKGVSAWLRRRRDAASDSARRALRNAETLETYAHDIWDLVAANDYGYAVGALPQSGYQYEFALPVLADGGSTGDGARDVRLEARWRDLQRMVGDVKRHVDEEFHSDFGGAEQALRVLERRAYQLADRALILARLYRRQFGLPQREPGTRERRREQRIHEEAIAGDRRPCALNLWALARYVVAVRRCAPARPRRTGFRSRLAKLARALRGVLSTDNPEP